MNNYELILEQRYRLLEQGIIGEEDKVYKLPDGEERHVLEPEEIHTITKWNALGYRVIDRTRPIAIFPIWSPVEVKKGKKKQTKLIKKDGIFYSKGQVTSK